MKLALPSDLHENGDIEANLNLKLKCISALTNAGLL